MMNPSLMAGAMAMMQQAAAANQANTSKDGGSDSAVTLDSELEEGEISPPDTPVQYNIWCPRKNALLYSNTHNLSFETAIWTSRGRF